MSEPTPTPPALCPCCGSLINAVTPLVEAEEAHRAAPGDVTFCYTCAAMLMFDANLRLLAVTPEMRVHLLSELPELHAAEKQVRDLAASARQRLADPPSEPDTGF